MTARKRARLAAAGLSRPQHIVVAVDVLADAGPLSLGEATRDVFDRTKGIAIITEGLLAYFDTPTTQGLWRRLAAFAAPFAGNVYLSDMHLGATMAGPAVAIFRRMLQVFARGRTHMHFVHEGDVGPALAAQGFRRTVVHRPRDWASELALPGVGGLETVQVLEASTRD
jgi:O-methyltransferase involved in polyketide biosynthesis